MQREYTSYNCSMIREDFSLHDAKISKISWGYQDRFISFDMTNWEWGAGGRLAFYGAVYAEGSALGLWGFGVTNAIYIDCFFADSDCSVSAVFTHCVQKSKSSPETCELPDPDNYFCVVFGTNTGDQLRFIVEKVVWETDD